MTDPELVAKRLHLGEFLQFADTVRKRIGG